jgi:hypothetical protein
VQQVTVTITRTPTGYLIEAPTLPSWAFHAHNLTALRDGIRRAFTETEIANYARFRGTVYDVALHHPDAFTHPAPCPVPDTGRRHPAEPVSEVPRVSYAKDATHRPDVHHPAAWTPLPDGGMQSPDGRRFAPGTRAVTAAAARREALGLPSTA